MEASTERIIVAAIVGLPAIIAAISSLINGRKLRGQESNSLRTADISAAILSEMRDLPHKRPTQAQNLQTGQKHVSRRGMPRRNPPAQPAE
jgi:hypothetical protein